MHMDEMSNVDLISSSKLLAPLKALDTVDCSDLPMIWMEEQYLFFFLFFWAKTEEEKKK